MQFEDLIQRRRSIRRFRPDPLPEGALDRILRAANLAPSAGNRQAYRIVVVRSPERKRALAMAAFGQTFIEEAPVLLVFLADPARSVSRYGRRGEFYALQDATIACTFAHLMAADMGLGSVWIGAFDDADVSRCVGAPQDMRPVAILPIGLPSEEPAPTGRRSLTEMVVSETF
jgi:nitroreductase